MYTYRYDWYFLDVIYQMYCTIGLIRNTDSQYCRFTYIVRKSRFPMAVGIYLNLSIYNIIRWFAEPMGQTTRRLSVWCSKYHHIFIKSSKILCKTLAIYFFYKITKMKIKSIKNYEKEILECQTLVDESFVPSAQRTSVLYCRLSDFYFLLISSFCYLPRLVS